jgi:predicted MFS family arabinose efflux permease
MNPPPKLFTRDFIILNVVSFFAFCNVAAFFMFNQYLSSISIEHGESGILISLFALAAMVLRPFISPFLNAANAKRFIAIGVIGVILSLLLYYPALSFWPLVVVRLLHGSFHVLLASAVTARVVAAIPPERSSQAFGLLTLANLLPYAVVPMAVELLVRDLADYPLALMILAVFMAVALGFLRLVPPVAMTREEAHLSWPEIKQNLSNIRVIMPLVISLFLFTAFSPVFFFLQGFGLKIGINEPGLFFTMSSCLEIAVRLFGGALMDRLPKGRLLAGAMLILAVGYFVLPSTQGPWVYFGLAVVFGVGWGLALPLVNALLFDVSTPRFRALNVNLGLEAFQSGMFFGPILGGILLGAAGFHLLFYACGVTVLVGMTLVLLFSRSRPAKKEG